MVASHQDIDKIWTTNPSTSLDPDLLSSSIWKHVGTGKIHLSVQQTLARRDLWMPRFDRADREGGATWKSSLCILDVKIYLIYVPTCVAFVRPAIISEQYYGQNNRSKLSRHDRDLSRQILRCIFCSESLRTDDVSHTKREGHDSSAERSRSVVRRVHSNQLVRQHHSWHDEVDEVDAGEGTGLVGCGQKAHQRASNHSRNA
jgi:hypothetical protein